MRGALNLAPVRYALRVLLRPFGRTVAKDHFARWGVVNGKITRTLYPFGWRIARLSEQSPQSQLEQFLRERS